MNLDIDGLIKARNSYSNNPMTEYLYITTLQNKKINLKEINAKGPLDVFMVDETKLVDNFPNVQFIQENVQFYPSLATQIQNGRWKVASRKTNHCGIICKKVENLEIDIFEKLFMELTISKKVACFIFI